MATPKGNHHRSSVRFLFCRRLLLMMVLLMALTWVAAISMIGTGIDSTQSSAEADLKGGHLLRGAGKLVDAEAQQLVRSLGVTNVTEALSKLRREMVRKTSQHKREVEALKLQHQQEIQKVHEQHKRLHQSHQATHAIEVHKLEQAHSAQLGSLKRSHALAVEEAKANVVEESNCTDKVRQNAAQMDQAHARAVSAMGASFTQEKAQAEIAHKAAVARLVKARNEEVELLKQAHKREIHGLRQAHRRQRLQERLISTPAPNSTAGAGAGAGALLRREAWEPAWGEGDEVDAREVRASLARARYGQQRQQEQRQRPQQPQQPHVLSRGLLPLPLRLRFMLVADLDKQSRRVVSVKREGTHHHHAQSTSLFYTYLQEGWLDFSTSGAAVGNTLVSSISTNSSISNISTNSSISSISSNRSISSNSSISSSVQAQLKVRVQWGDKHRIRSKLGEAGRGLELSELVQYHGMLLTMDDRSGVVYQIRNQTQQGGGGGGGGGGGSVGSSEGKGRGRGKGKRAVVRRSVDGGWLLGSLKAVPRAIVMEGDGNSDKGAKTEWACAKDGVLHMGGIGKEYVTPTGEISSTSALWVTTLDATGRVRHHNWSIPFARVRAAAGCPYPGYLIHEAVLWSQVRREWIFLPRRVSAYPHAYDEVLDEARGGNTVIVTDEHFTPGRIRSFHVGTRTPARGFSSAKFVPGSNETLVLAVKSEESDTNQTQDSYLTVFHLPSRATLMQEVRVPGKLKFEGVEFILNPAGIH